MVPYLLGGSYRLKLLTEQKKCTEISHKLRILPSNVTTQREQKLEASQTEVYIGNNIDKVIVSINVKPNKHAPQPLLSAVGVRKQKTNMIRKPTWGITSSILIAECQNQFPFSQDIQVHFACSFFILTI